MTAERMAENALKVISKVTITKTIILPVSPDITKKKLNYIERLSARVTYAVTLYLDIIIKNDITKLSGKRVSGVHRQKDGAELSICSMCKRYGFGDVQIVQKVAQGMVKESQEA